jgi:hypothetical protein
MSDFKITEAVLDKVYRALIEQFGESIHEDDDMSECSCDTNVAEAKKKSGPKKGVTTSHPKAKTPEWVRKAIKKKPAPNEPLHPGLRADAHRRGKINY